MPRISALTELTTLASTDYTVIVEDDTSDVTKKMTLATLMTFVHSRTVAIPVMAPAIRPQSANGCATLACVAAGSGQPDMTTLDFDASAVENGQFGLAMPSSWNEGTITAKFYWSHPATTTNFDVVWGISAVAVSNNEAMAVSFGTAQTVTDTGGTTDKMYVTSATSAMPRLAAICLLSMPATTRCMTSVSRVVSERSSSRACACSALFRLCPRARSSA